MRRRFKIFLPIVMLTMLVQLLAPIASFRFVASAISDPLLLASICSGSVSSQGGQSVPSGGAVMHGNCCAVCGAGLSSPSLIDPPPVLFVTLQRNYERIVWFEPAEPASTFRAGSNAQARAPPQLT